MCFLDQFDDPKDVKRFKKYSPTRTVVLNTPRPRKAWHFLGMAHLKPIAQIDMAACRLLFCRQWWIPLTKWDVGEWLQTTGQETASTKPPGIPRLHSCIWLFANCKYKLSFVRRVRTDVTKNISMTIDDLQLLVDAGSASCRSAYRSRWKLQKGQCWKQIGYGWIWNN